MKIDQLEGQAKEFAIACYNYNSLDELKEAASSDAGATDCRVWGINEQQWRSAIEAALSDMLADAQE